MFPETSNIHPQLEIAALNEPGRQVSGDYYDILKMADGNAGIVIADVVGKGVAAALIAANLQAAIRVLMPRTTDLAATASELNALLHQNTDTSRFVTVILAIIDLEANQLYYVSAGHHAPMALHPDGRIEVADERGGLPFGIDEDTDYGCISLDLGAGPTTLFFYTDGLNEAMNGNEEEFGLDRIYETLRSQAAAPPQELLKNMREAVSDFSGDVPQGDDITMLAIRTSGGTAGG